MTPYEILTKAQDLIRDPKHWTQGAYARDKNGEIVAVDSTNAFCFCSVGAIVSRTNDWLESEEAIAILADDVGSISRFNDSIGTTHAEVMDAFDRARELALQEKHA